jgi:hypothetical protein
MRHKVIVIEGRRRVGRRLNKAHLKVRTLRKTVYSLLTNASSFACQQHPPINKIEPIDINDDEDTEEVRVNVWSRERKSREFLWHTVNLTDPLPVFLPSFLVLQFTPSNRKTTSHVELPHISTTFKSCRMPATGFPARDLGRRRRGDVHSRRRQQLILPAGPNGD